MPPIPEGWAICRRRLYLQIITIYQRHQFQQAVCRVLKLAIYFSNSVARSLGAQSNFNGQKSVHPVCSNTYMQELESACPCMYQTMVSKGLI